MNRRDFFKVAGAGMAAAGTVSLPGCISERKDNESGKEGNGKMEYRTSPKNGEKISLLGYGCMRWPMKKGDDGISTAQRIWGKCGN